MTALVPISLIGWIGVAVALFAIMRPQLAVIWGFMLGWLFLPIAEYAIPGIPDYDKVTATSVGVLMGAVLFDAGRLMSYRFRLIDLPMIIWCLCPFASSMTNGLGMYDGVSAVVSQTLTWGVPFFLGRVYLADVSGLRAAAVAIFVGGLIYVPLCIYEIRMSPQLHNMVYGFHQHTFGQTWRLGGYRPTVFLQHGLMVGMWMTAASFVGVWLWASGTVKRVGIVPIGLLVVGLIAVTILCKSLGAIALLLVGVGVLVMVKGLGSRLAVYALIAMIPLYLYARIGARWDGAEAVEFAASINPDRADSLAGRIENEVLLVDKAMQRPVFGWGGWSRSRIVDDFGEDDSTTDSQWIIALGQRGLVGLFALNAALLLPSILLTLRFKAKSWVKPAFAPAAALSLVLVLYAFDNLVNAMVNPVFVLCAGGLAGALAATRVAVTRTQRVPVRRMVSTSP